MRREKNLLIPTFPIVSPPGKSIPLVGGQLPPCGSFEFLRFSKMLREGYGMHIETIFF